MVVKNENCFPFQWNGGETEQLEQNASRNCPILGDGRPAPLLLSMGHDLKTNILYLKNKSYLRYKFIHNINLMERTPKKVESRLVSRPVFRNPKGAKFSMETIDSLIGISVNGIMESYGLHGFLWGQPDVDQKDTANNP